MNKKEKHTNLAEVFSDPFDPSKSLQLNNKYWPSESYSLLSLLQDCQASIADKIDSNCAPFKRLRKLLGSESIFEKLLRRLGKIQCFQSDFGYLIKEVAINERLIRDIKYMEEQDLGNGPLPSTGHFDDVSKMVKSIYLSEYGWDIAKAHKSVRYAKAQAIPDLGPMSDYHNDELKGITCIIYLSDVNPSNGAFSFIAGSQYIPRSSVLTAIHQTVCFDLGLTKPNQMEALPLEFRCTPIIGNFVEIEKSKILLESNVVFEGPPGSTIIFNGQRLIHRGGRPISGSRYAAFVVMEGILIHKIRSLVSQLRH
jgi:hypothetical protein